MPNWYSGTTKITGDIQIFKDWVQEKYSKNENLDNFAQTFAPLSSGEWDYGTACKEWGAKWDFEIDLIVGPKNKGAILTVVDRLSRQCIIEKLGSKGSKEIKDILFNALRNYDGEQHSITSDKGSR